jgi:hypothetical protein
MWPSSLRQLGKVCICYLVHFIVEKLPIYVSGDADRIRIQFLIPENGLDTDPACGTGPDPA